MNSRYYRTPNDDGDEPISRDDRAILPPPPRPSQSWEERCRLGNEMSIDNILDRSMLPPRSIREKRSREQDHIRSNDDMGISSRQADLSWEERCRLRNERSIEDMRSGRFGSLGRLDDELNNERSIRRQSSENDFYDRPSSFMDDSRFRGVIAADGRRRPCLLTEAFPGDMRPNAQRRFPTGRRGRQAWPGHNETMPEGAIGYIGRDEPEGFGRPNGPFMHPTDRKIDLEYVRRHEKATREDAFFQVPRGQRWR